MKILHLFLSILLISFSTAYSQTEKGKQNLGIDLGISLSSGEFYNDTKETGKATDTYLFVGPSYSYFINNNTDMGINLAYKYDQTKGASSDTFQQDKTQSKSYTGGIFIRRYLMVSKKFGIRNGAILSYLYGKDDSTTWSNNSPYEINYSHYTYSGAITFDLVFYPAKRIGLSSNIANFFVNFNKYNLDAGETYKSRGVGLRALSSLNITFFRVF